MPIRFRKLREAGRKARGAVAFIRYSFRREKREREAGSEARKQRPTQNSARAQRSQQRRRAQWAEHRANRIHRAFESKRAAFLPWRDGASQQRVARWPTAAAPPTQARASPESSARNARRRKRTSKVRWRNIR